MNGKKKWNRVRFVAAIAGGVSASCRPVGGSALQQLGDLICGVFLLLLLAGGGCFVRSMNGAEQADKGRWLVFPLTILY